MSDIRSETQEVRVVRAEDGTRIYDLDFYALNGTRRLLLARRENRSIETKVLSIHSAAYQIDVGPEELAEALEINNLSAQ